MREYGIFNGSEVKDAILKMHQRSCPSLTDFEYNPEMLCPKIYTTRTRRLSGEYVVVEGSRFRAKPVEPEIKFNVSISEELDLKRAIFKKDDNIIGWAIANRGDLTFPELDLGIKGATFEHLKNELLRLNKKATIETPFYVNLIEPIL